MWQKGQGGADGDSEFEEIWLNKVALQVVASLYVSSQKSPERLVTAVWTDYAVFEAW